MTGNVRGSPDYSRYWIFDGLGPGQRKYVFIYTLIMLSLTQLHRINFPRLSTLQGSSDLVKSGGSAVVLKDTDSQGSSDFVKSGGSAVVLKDTDNQEPIRDNRRRKVPLDDSSSSVREPLKETSVNVSSRSQTLYKIPLPIHDELS